MSREAFKPDMLEMAKKLSRTCCDHSVRCHPHLGPPCHNKARHIWILVVLLLITACQGTPYSCSMPW